MNVLVSGIAQAIATFEGFYLPGSVASRNNNPGNLRSWGSTPTSGGFAVFPSVSAGWDALKRQVQLNIDRGLTLREFFGGKSGVYPGYAPSADNNDPARYASFVGSKVGIPADVPLSSWGSLPVFIPTPGGVPTVAPAGDVVIAAAVIAAVAFAVLLMS